MTDTAPEPTTRSFGEHEKAMKDAAQAGSIPILGVLCWYSLSDVRVQHRDVIAALIASGIGTNLPLPPKDADVFRRVATKSERKKVPTTTDGMFENYLLRDLNADTDFVYKRVVRETVDSKGKVLSYDQLIDVTFEKTTSAIIIKRLEPGPDEGDDVVNQLRKEFLAQQGSLDSYAVREWIRKFLLALDATQVRPGGGVYFVRNEHLDKIDGLEQFTAQLPGQVVFHSLPLIDSKKQRSMLQAAFEAETADEIDSLITEIQEIQSTGRKIGAGRYEDFLNRYHALVEKTNEYADLLETKLDTTHSRLEIFMKSMVQLTASKR